MRDSSESELGWLMVRGRRKRSLVKKGRNPVTSILLTKQGKRRFQDQ
jgi:hypothetical protein